VSSFANVPRECAVLVHELCLREPPCETCIAPEFFSFWRPIDEGKRRPAGCWIAHTALTALECARLRPRLERALRRLGMSWSAVEMLAVLHDVGKLSEPYGRRSMPGHNVLSMVVASSVCGPSSPISQAVFLHHEAMHWRDIYRIGLHQHITIPPLTKRIINRGFRLRHGYIGALERLNAFLDIMGVEGAGETIEGVMARASYRMAPQEAEFYIRYFSPKAMSLYWVLFLADNRAASARETSEAYWLDVVRRAFEEARSPAELSDILLRRAGRLTHISLTALFKPGERGASCH